MTGTPVHNRLHNLDALIKFLRIKPFILSPFKNTDPEILPKLRLLVDGITLRRLKNWTDPLTRHDHSVRLQLNKKEKDLYELFARLLPERSNNA